MTSALPSEWASQGPADCWSPTSADLQVTLSTQALPFIHICFLSLDSVLLSLVKRFHGPCVFTALNAVSEAVMGGGGDAGQPTLLNGEALIFCLRSSPGMPSGTLLHHLPFLTQAPLPPVGKSAQASHTETSHRPSSEPCAILAASTGQGGSHPSTGVGGTVCPSEGRSAPETQSAQL